MNLTIRPETPADIPVIAEITRRAFEFHPHSQQTEQFIIAALRAACALSVSLVAELDGRLVGHIALSPVEISDGSTGWFGLGPISVMPELQNRGIGTRLMHDGLNAIRRLNAKGCALAGDPKFYERFGFQANPKLTLEGVPPQYFLCLGLDGSDPAGEVVFHPAFSAQN